MRIRSNSEHYRSTRIYHFVFILFQHRVRATTMGDLQSVTNPMSQTTTFDVYTPDGRILQSTDPNGVVTQYAYDARQHLVSRSVGGETTSIAYYPTGTVRQIASTDGSFVQYGYDEAHRLTQVADGQGNHMVYTLDGLANPTATNLYDSYGALTFAKAQVFDALGELHQQIGSAGTSAVTTTFGYDSNGNQTSINAPLARNTSTQYDSLDRATHITDAAGGVTTLSYDQNDNPTSVVDPNGLVTGYTYDGFGEVVRQSSPGTGITVNSYDSAGNLTSSTDARNKTGAYTYDAQNRVTQAAYDDQIVSFGYDSGPNGVGRLTSAGDANHSMTWSYDGLGRVVTKVQTVGSGPSAVTKTVSYRYTQGDLVALRTPSGQTISYTNTLVAASALSR